MNNYLNAVSIENDLEFNLYIQSVCKIKKFDPPYPTIMGLSLRLQDLLYISQVPTLFAVTNKHEK